MDNSVDFIKDNAKLRIANGLTRNEDIPAKLRKISFAVWYSAFGGCSMGAFRGNKALLFAYTGPRGHSLHRCR